MEEENQFQEPILAHNSLTSLEFLDIAFPCDEAIIDAMIGQNDHGRICIIDHISF
jgi:hypothetical protein